MCNLEVLLNYFTVPVYGSLICDLSGDGYVKFHVVKSVPFFSCLFVIIVNRFV